MRKKLSILSLILIMGFMFCAYTAGDERVFDQASLFTEEEAKTIQSELNTQIEALKCDIAILTVQDAGGSSTEDYTEKFYLDHQMGYDATKQTGVIFTIDMDNRKMWVTTRGEARDYIDSRVDTILDDVYSDVKDGNYVSAVESFLKDMNTYMWTASDNGVNSETNPDTDYASVDTKPTFWEKATKYILPELGIALLIAGGITLIIAFSNRAKTTTDNHTYLEDNALIMHNQSDIYTHTTTTRTKINTDNNSSSGGGGGGGDFGGGGRSF